MVYSGKESAKECIYLKLNQFGVAQMIKKFACSGGHLGLIPELGRSPGERNGNPFQYSCLENSIDREPGRGQFMGSQRVGHN